MLRQASVGEASRQFFLLREHRREELDGSSRHRSRSGRHPIVASYKAHIGLRQRRLLPMGHIYPQISDHPAAVPPRAGNGASTSRDGQFALIDPDDVDADKLPQQ